MKEKIISEELYNIAKENNYPLNFITIGNTNDVPTNIPTHSQLQLWLWETYTIHVSVIPIYKNNKILFQYRIIPFINNKTPDEILEYSFNYQNNDWFQDYNTQYEAWDNGLITAMVYIKKLN